MSSSSSLALTVSPPETMLPSFEMGSLKSMISTTRPW